MIETIVAGIVLLLIAWLANQPRPKAFLRRLVSRAEPFLGAGEEPNSTPSTAPPEFFFGLGNHVALICWVKHGPDTEEDLARVLQTLVTLIEHLGLPDRVRKAVVDYYEQKQSDDGDMASTANSMLTLRSLFAMSIRGSHGGWEEKVFSFAFGLTNAVYMCESPSLVPRFRGPLAQSLVELEATTRDLGLDPEPIEQILELVRSAQTKDDFVNLYARLHSCMSQYEEELKRLSRRHE